MSKSKVFSFAAALTGILALCFLLASCLGEDTKDGTIILTNSSSYSEDNPVTAQLLQGSNVLGETSLGKGKKIEWSGVPPEVSLSITVTDQNGRTRRESYIYLKLGETQRYSYNGSGISRIYNNN
jgi:hypothetical protein